jgi:acyl-coenzyme A synthetase/AMP-(fatty) acid ligase
MFAAWRKGACVYVTDSVSLKYFSIIDTIRKHHLTVSFFVPTVLLYLEKYLPELSLPSLRYSFFSGDRLYAFAAEKWSRCAVNASIYNCYGPTETTIICTFDGMEVVLVNEKGKVLKKGLGEICVTGPQVFDGYADGNDPEVFMNISKRKFYRSGDLGSLDADGKLQFEGRKDLQAKINGFRVQTVAIENRIRQISNRNAVVMVFHKEYIPYLVAFVEGEYEEHKHLKTALSEELPDYMIPLTFIFIDSFPLNDNGKISYSGLRELYHD